MNSGEYSSLLLIKCGIEQILNKKYMNFSVLKCNVRIVKDLFRGYRDKANLLVKCSTVPAKN